MSNIYEQSQSRKIKVCITTIKDDTFCGYIHIKKGVDRLTDHLNTYHGDFITLTDVYKSGLLLQDMLILNKRYILSISIDEV